MSTFNGLVNKLKKFTRFTSAKFKAPKAIKVKNELDKLATFIKQFNDETDKNLFKSKVSQIFKSPTAISNYYKPGENEKDVYQKSGLAGIIFQELYTYLTTGFTDNNTKNMPGWFSNCKNRNDLKKSFKLIYVEHFKSDKAWISSILYNDKVIDALYNIIKFIKDKISKQDNQKTQKLLNTTLTQINTKLHSTTDENKDKNFKEIKKSIEKILNKYNSVPKLVLSELYDYIDATAKAPYWFEATTPNDLSIVILSRRRTSINTDYDYIYSILNKDNMSLLFNIVKKIKELTIDNNKNESPKTHQATKPKQSKKEVRFDKSVTIAYRDPEVSTDTEDLKDEPKKTI